MHQPQEAKGLPLIILIRFSPVPPWVYSNALFASINSVAFWQFMVATMSAPFLLFGPHTNIHSSDSFNPKFYFPYSLPRESRSLLTETNEARWTLPQKRSISLALCSA